eukprot:CAMPEP_0201656886 /NCGR_PEP_ID=MMETSP0494-20130426/290_1 /ASSEMBLY_ACC=CAM_ASM_000839 /TAXON_ID=420259 /ORGANISM="Thalassiosira gravida, Strain GMp14c1" /LENGTH=1051 /DNA_ID=CAMNT_0048133595 /DNA_START=279 /DNA_END=3434 /DNA_ORIENTATION=-
MADHDESRVGRGRLGGNGGFYNQRKQLRPSLQRDGGVRNITVNLGTLCPHDNNNKNLNVKDKITSAVDADNDNDNDENACPNQRPNNKRAIITATTNNNNNNERRSSRSMGPKVAKLAALFDDDNDENCHHSTHSTNSTKGGNHCRSSFSSYSKSKSRRSSYDSMGRKSPNARSPLGVRRSLGAIDNIGHRSYNNNNNNNNISARNALALQIGSNKTNINDKTNNSNDNNNNRDCITNSTPDSPARHPSTRNDDSNSTKRYSMGRKSPKVRSAKLGVRRFSGGRNNISNNFSSRSRSNNYCNNTKNNSENTLAVQPGSTNTNASVYVSNININDDKININNNSTKNSPAPHPAPNDTNIQHEKEQRRKLLLQERRSQKKLERTSIRPVTPSFPMIREIDDGGEDEGIMMVVVDNDACRRLRFDGGSDSNVGEMTNSRNDDCSREEACVKSKEWKTTLLAKASSTTSPSWPIFSSFGSKLAPTRALAFASQLVLFLLALFQYLISPVTRTGVFGILSELFNGWGDDVFHVGFVVAFFVRAVVVSLAMTRRRWSTKTDEKGVRDSSTPFRTMLFFLLVISCWMALLPMFKDCGSEANTAASDNGQFCFFVGSSSSTLWKGVVASSSHGSGILSVSSPRYSLMDLLATIWYKNTKLIVKSKIKGRLIREIQRGLWRPLAFRGRLKKLLLFLRWAKFLAPLAGACNKFRGHVLDTIQKRRQHIASQKARKRWNDLLDALSQRSKSERAVLELQKRFRERREIKARRRFALMTPERNASDSRVAHRIRKRLAEVQLSSRSKLNRMKVLDGQRKRRRMVSDDEREGIVRHERNERRLKKRLLLSPKTYFAVGWKCLTVACVALEISQIVFAPVLSGEMKKMPLDKFLSRVLGASSSRCGDGSKKKSIVSTAPLNIFIPVINNVVDMACPASSWRQAWHVATDLIATTVLVPIVNAIFFLDVFVTFFTGELTSSATLVPKPFFARYILPGVGLQLLVNPAMVEISRLAKGIIVRAVHVGPSLCFHLLLGCIPFVGYLYDCLLDIIFDFVERQNMVVTK